MKKPACRTPALRALPRLCSLLLLAAASLLPNAAVLAADAAPNGLPAVAPDSPALKLAKYRGKVVYLDFWASWCGPCAQSFPWMKKMQETYGKDGLVIIGVNVDQERRLGEAFVENQRPNFPIVFEGGSQLAAAYRVPGMPTAVLIGRDGKPRQRHVGWRADQRGELEASLKALLAEPTPH